MPADNQHAEVERVIVEALSEGRSPSVSDLIRELVALVPPAIRTALHDGRLTPDQVAAAVGLRAELVDDCYEECNNHGVARLAVASAPTGPR